MGAAESSVGRHRTNPNPNPPPSSSRYDWDKEEGGYIPYRFQTEHRRRWRQEDKRVFAQRVRDNDERERNREALVRNFDAGGEKERLKVGYREHLGRKKRAESQRQGQRRDEVEWERKGKGVKFFEKHERKGSLRGWHEERGRGGEREAAGKKEKIRVYASPDLQSDRSEYST